MASGKAPDGHETDGHEPNPSASVGSGEGQGGAKGQGLVQGPQGEKGGGKEGKPWKEWEDYHGVIPLDKRLREKLKVLKKEMGFRTYDGLVQFMVLEISRGALIPPASYEKIMTRDETRPCIITAESGGGKTTTVKGMIERWTGNAFVLDVSDEYKDLKQIDLGEFFSLKWERPDQRVRFVPNPNVMISQAEAATIFSHLNFVKNSGLLKGWVIVIEEGHRFSNDVNLRALLIEARKFVRKLIIVTTDWKVYEGIARTYKPMPWQAVAVEEAVPV